MEYVYHLDVGRIQEHDQDIAIGDLLYLRRTGFMRKWTEDNDEVAPHGVFLGCKTIRGKKYKPYKSGDKRKLVCLVREDDPFVLEKRRIMYEEAEHLRDECMKHVSGKGMKFLRQAEWLLRNLGGML